MDDTLSDDNPVGHAQIRDESDTPDSNIAGDKSNADQRHNIEAALLRFLDRPLPLETALALGAEALAEDMEKIACAIDHLADTGQMVFFRGFVCKAALGDGVTTEYDNDRHDGFPDNTPQQPSGGVTDPRWAPGHVEWIKKNKPAMPCGPQDLNFGGECSNCSYSGKHDKQLPLKGFSNVSRNTWAAIYNRHPEWRGKIVGNRFIYDVRSVQAKDREEFEHFLSLDVRIDAKDPVKAQAKYRMVGGKVLGVGLTAQGFVRVAIAEINDLPSRGDLVYSLAEDMALSEHNSSLVELPFDKQQKLLERAEDKVMTDNNMWSQADMTMTTEDPNAPPPAPDSEKAPQGWESISDNTGKKTWRSKTDPNVKLERPQQ